MILVAKGKNEIVISKDGKKLTLGKGTILYNKLIDKSKDEILEWYISRGY